MHPHRLPGSAPDLEGPLAKAETEFADYTEEEVSTLLHALDDLLNHWATANGYGRAFKQTGFTAMTEWLLPGESPHNIPTDTITLMLEHILKHPTPAFSDFLTQLSDDPSQAHLKLFALLIVREYEAGNGDGVKQAALAHDQFYCGVRPLVDVGLKTKQSRKHGGKQSAKHRNLDHVAPRRQRVKTIALKLLNDGHSKHDLASFIAQHHIDDVSTKTIRTDLQTLGILEKRKRT